MNLCLYSGHKLVLNRITFFMASKAPTHYWEKANSELG